MFRGMFVHINFEGTILVGSAQLRMNMVVEILNGKFKLVAKHLYV